ncbi:hypothetical protein M427DRAFT_490419 [Gonapodya prolifera JEL478]|uniref:F-box domain-containing protein n=1 Tax=Gonapodya prolifera (strain JEL478) TaxID=1344416 RepID=A0A138ZY84_GONPJ|nr:hypothetical protein M427DRAFT_490419 [Gonapodya prolifera JEL478]|eukprot:KXS09472.1 hypothetical protein M427DRAFT_490419 [Gonapodya prolifera JEL478]
MAPRNTRIKQAKTGDTIQSAAAETRSEAHGLDVLPLELLIQVVEWTDPKTAHLLLSRVSKSIHAAEKLVLSHRKAHCRSPPKDVRAEGSLLEPLRASGPIRADSWDQTGKAERKEQSSGWGRLDGCTRRKMMTKHWAVQWRTRVDRTRSLQITSARGTSQIPPPFMLRTLT